MKPTTRSKRKTATHATTDFSFSSDRPRYADKDVYVASATVFGITELAFQPGQGYNGADRWAATVVSEDGTTEIITLQANEKRNAQLQDAKDHIAARGAICNVRLVKHGNTFYFRTAEPRGS
jgi:hypothetical protein